MQYQWVNVRNGDRVPEATKINALAQEGWVVVPGTTMGNHLLMRRPSDELPSNPGAWPGPEAPGQLPGLT